MIVRFCCLLLMFNCILSQLLAQSFDKNKEQTEDASDPVGLEINGLIIDKTRTKMGRDFYQLFYTAWEAPNTKTDYIITISEQPSKGRGSRVFVYVNEYLPFRAFLQPNLSTVPQNKQPIGSKILLEDWTSWIKILGMKI